MNEIIKYFESLEQRIAALERRVAETEKRAAELEARKPEVVEKMVEVPVEQPVAETETEPEVEVEFIFDESPIEETIDTSSTSKSSDTSDTSDTSVASATSAPVPEPAPAPVPEPISQPQAAQKFSTQIGASVDDIRKAISLGDRFLFTRELFDNQGEKMQMVLDEINAKQSMEDAIAYLDKHFSWDKESKTYQLFEVALKRRFC